MPVFRRSALALLAALALAAPAAAHTVRSAPSAAVQRWAADPAFKRAAALVDADHDRWIGEVIAITEIPAPPFKEQVRAEAYARMLRDAGLTDVSIDAEGNVLALRKGTRPGPAVVVSAHLDTVFPEGTPIKVRREGD
ncbi:MAG: peptidase M20, partial [Pseudomonadota bacterium]|nr:peptidase M20 [Pseudomonadota bacterium]